MPILRNARHEIFAQAIVDGKSLTEAYAAAGYRANRGNASHLRQKQDVSDRIAELLAEREKVATQSTARAIERTAITKERIATELARIAFANMADYTRLVGPERVLDLSAADREQLAAVMELTVEDFKDGRGDDARDVRRVKMKLADKRAALVDLAKLFGYIVDRRDVRVLRSLNDLTDDELAALVAEAESGLDGSRASGGPSKTKH